MYILVGAEGLAMTQYPGTHVPNSQALVVLLRGVD